MRRRDAVLLLAILAGFPAIARSQDDRDADVRLSTEMVMVNVVVRHGSDFARGLAQSDFTVTEDGAPQAIEFFGAETTPFAATILLDTSGSMEHKLRLARVAAARFTDRTRPVDTVALFLFGSEVRRLNDFVPGGRDVADGIWDTTAEGMTKMYDCLDMAVDALGARAERRRVVLLISDGADTGSRLNYDEAVRKAQSAGVTIYTVDVTAIGSPGAQGGPDDARARAILRGLADRTGGRFFVSKGGTDLNDAFTRIVEEIGQQYTLGYVSTNTRHDGTFRRIGVRCSRSGVSIRAREGYRAAAE